MGTEKKKILIIDDDITALDIVSFLFEQKGFAVERKTDGFGAIDYVKEHTPDLIVVDLRMPGIDGVETVKRIRALGISVPIIAFTAVDEPQLHYDAEQAGCNRVLTKPCRPDKLLEHINQLLMN